jgi:GNAT superfamily N-acetyltransferase
MPGPSTTADPDPASSTAALALEADPFYQSITVDHEQDPPRRRSALAAYFSLSIEEGRRIGRAIHLEDPAFGVAVWHLPQTQEVEANATEHKRVALSRVLGPAGLENYDRILGYMAPRADRVVPPGSWYLSIIAVDPSQQGRGLGQRLLAPTLAEADARGAACFLETFSPRSRTFYSRLGFRERATFSEPTTGADYVLMVRELRSHASSQAR